MFIHFLYETALTSVLTWFIIQYNMPDMPHFQASISYYIGYEEIENNHLQTLDLPTHDPRGIKIGTHFVGKSGVTKNRTVV